MPSFSQRSLDRLATCHPDLNRLFTEVVKHFDCTVLCGHRGQEEQDKAAQEKARKQAERAKADAIAKRKRAELAAAKLREQQKMARERAAKQRAAERAAAQGQQRDAARVASGGKMGLLNFASQNNASLGELLTTLG